MKQLATLIVTLILGLGVINGQTIIADKSNVSGTWTKANSPYIVNGLATVPQGSTLTIEPGVEVRFKTGTDFSFYDNIIDAGVLYVKGMLIAEGTPAQKIKFTRDGSSGNWGNLTFAKVANVSTLKYCRIEFANQIQELEANTFSTGAIAILNPYTKVLNSEIVNNNATGIFTSNSNPLLTNNIVANNKSIGVSIKYAYSINDTIIFANNTIVDNSGIALDNYSVKLKIVNSIFWNNNAGSFSTNYKGWNSMISHCLFQEDKFIYDGFSIKAGIIYGLNPKLKPDYSPENFSPCINEGIPDTSGLKLGLTDCFGNTRVYLDRIDIGAGESISPKYMCITYPSGKEGFFAGREIDIRWKSNVSTLKLEYTVNGGTSWSVITNSTENDGQFKWAIPAGETQAFNIRLSDPSDASYSDQCDDNLSILNSNIPDGTILSGRLTLQHSPYLMNGFITVPLGDSLIIDPGVELRFKTGTDFSYYDKSFDVGLLYIRGKLIANGTQSQKIKFTREGSSGNWGNLTFGKVAAVSTLKYCLIEYANQIQDLEYNSYSTGAVTILNPSTKILNSEIVNNLNTGIYSNNSNPVIINNIVANNKSIGVSIKYAFAVNDTIILANNTIVDNSGIALDNYSVKLKIVNSIFWNNNAGSFSTNYKGWNSMISHCLFQEDKFIYDGFSIKAGIIYGLNPKLKPDYSPENFSPCINEGIPDTSGLKLGLTDCFGNTRVYLDRIDIGAGESISPKYMCITYPSGKEGFFAGREIDIRWKSSVSTLKLEYTVNGGTSWSVITNSTENDGQFKWAIPAGETQAFNIRLSDPSDASYSDQCDDNLSILNSNIPDGTILSGRLTLQHSPYLMNGFITVPLGDSLIIDPGVELRFKTGTDFSYYDKSFDVGLLYIRGKLIANGTQSQKIKFTREGSSGNWGNLTFGKVAAVSTLKYCLIEYANQIQDLEYNSYSTGAVTILNPSTKILNSEIVNNLNTGIYSNNSNPVIINNIVANNKSIGVSIKYAFAVNDTIILANNTIVDNSGIALDNYSVKLKIVNSIFWNNNAGSFSTNYKAWNSTISYSLFQDDKITYPGFILKKGNISNIDPQFINYSNLNYHLKVTSPAMDSGDPAFPYTNEPFNNGGRIDLGAYGNTAEATISQSLPAITYLSIRSGSMLGNDTIVIKGNNILSVQGSGKIKFFGTEPAKYVKWSNDTIICITPAHRPGVFGIHISNNENKNGVYPNSFTFNPPIINKLLPVYTGVASNSSVKFSGSLFGKERNGNKLFFGANEATGYTQWKDTVIVVNSPSHAKGLVDLVFSVNDSVSYTFKESFLYTDEPVTELCGTLPDLLHRSKNYLITCPVTVTSGKTLTIEPDVTVMVSYKKGNELSIRGDGDIIANGTQSEPVRFISMPQEKGYWKGIDLYKNGTFSNCIIRDAIDGIVHRSGTLSITNSELSNNSNSGLRLSGDESYSTATIDKTFFTENKNGIDAYADCNQSGGSVTLNISGSQFTKNSESGIKLYSTGSTSGFSVPISKSSSINLKLTNSYVSNNSGYALSFESLGFIDTDYSPDAHRYGNVTFISENNLIFNNSLGIKALRKNTTHCTMKVRLYNTNLFNNKSTIEMDADEVFVYNSNLWDNSASTGFEGICDNLVIKNSNLNSISSLPAADKNISANPLYVSATSGNFNLQAGSPAIEKGSNDFVTFNTDYDGKVRIIDSDGNGISTVDIGAFETGTVTFSVDPASLNLHYSAGSNASFNVNSNFNWTVTSNQTWLTLSSPSGTCNGIIIATASANNVASPRTATITITGGGVHVKTITVTQAALSVGIEDVNESDILIYPIPVSDKLNISFAKSNPEARLYVYSSTGTLIIDSKLTGITNEVDMSNYGAGIYFIRIISDEKVILIRKIVKQ